jgi:hypothetical protein
VNRARRNLVTYTVLGGLIVVLGAYLLLRDRDRMRYVLPRLAAVETAQADRIIIGKEQGGFSLARAGEEWRLEPRGYRADPGVVSAMISAAAGLEITDLVSVTRDYRRYGLDDAARVEVTVQGDAKTLRRFDIGERAKTYSHTYVRLDGDERVFHAAGDLRSTFDVDPESVRDKVILSFDASLVSSLRIERGSEALELTAKAPESGKAREWTPSDGKAREAATVEDAVRSLSRLSCLRYAEGPDPPGRPMMTVLVRVRDAEHRLEVFPESDLAHPARSSQSEYLFQLPAWQIESLEKLLGP